MKKKVGIIGLGDIAKKAYLPVLASHPQVDIVGIAARTAETVQDVGERYRISNKYTELDELLHEKLDAIFVHTPTDTHEDIVCRCMEKGVHVYVDKPLSYDIEASRRMIETARATDRLLAVGFNRRFAPLYLKAKEWMDEAGGFDLLIAEKHRTRQQKLSMKETFYDDLIHMIDLLLWMGAAPHELTSMLNQQDDNGRLLHATGTLQFDGGAAAVFSMNRRAGKDMERVELHGGGRSIAVTNLEHAIAADRSTGEQSFGFGSWETISERRGFAGIIDHFIASLDAPEQCSIAGERVWDTHVLIEQLTKR
ncbi:Gfo/Idh/MocA family protein [Paenibacillus sp. 1001270B_150601_E10]|uniref:Gfo/Idh/MocA family protein n=1 Tax=Paenibacillus sp. 1001270B_150601_E10 TaxID=2787079 RepID=UPI00189D3832|nr:Gfo/Idh/MocA family oxidoreductase [Paenibacillus sp. 1001270B_150601_E10]